MFLDISRDRLIERDILRNNNTVVQEEYFVRISTTVSNKYNNFTSCIKSIFSLHIRTKHKWFNAQVAEVANIRGLPM